MGKKTTYERLKGSERLRQRLVLSTLASTPILIDDICAEDMLPGLRPHEISLLCLFERICDDCVVEINETGTKLEYKPGIVMGGRNLVHDCGVSRSIGYFLEPLILVGLFAKKPIIIRLRVETYDLSLFRELQMILSIRSVDTFRSTTLPLLKRFGVPSEGLELKIESRGSPPHGGGEVILAIPIVDKLMAVNWLDERMVKRIRGVSFSTRVSSQFENTMIHAACGIFNRLLPDVHILTDHKASPQAGKSPGYGTSPVAETTSGCFISVDTAVSYARGEVGEIEYDEKRELMPPDNVGEHIASCLLEEIEKGGVVDSIHQDCTIKVWVTTQGKLIRLPSSAAQDKKLNSIRYIYGISLKMNYIEPIELECECSSALVVLAIYKFNDMHK